MGRGVCESYVRQLLVSYFFSTVALPQSIRFGAHKLFTGIEDASNFSHDNRIRFDLHWDTTQFGKDVCADSQVLELPVCQRTAERIGFSCDRRQSKL